jgi:hypothetical protein
MCIPAIFSIQGEIAFPIGFHAADDFSFYHLFSINPKYYSFILVELYISRVIAVQMLSNMP